jgi:RHS repeat-associated protein
VEKAAKRRGLFPLAAIMAFLATAPTVVDASLPRLTVDPVADYRPPLPIAELFGLEEPSSHYQSPSFTLGLAETRVWASATKIGSRDWLEELVSRRKHQGYTLFGYQIVAGYFVDPYGVPAAYTDLTDVPDPGTADYDGVAAAGNTLGDRFPGGQNLLFQGLWTDPVTGISYARARWYDARNASWLSEDPKGDIDSPNLYTAFKSNPALYIDPFGKCVNPFDDECREELIGEWAALGTSLKRRASNATNYAGERVADAAQEMSGQLAMLGSGLKNEFSRLGESSKEAASNLADIADKGSDYAAENAERMGNATTEFYGLIFQELVDVEAAQEGISTLKDERASPEEREAACFLLFACYTKTWSIAAGTVLGGAANKPPVPRYLPRNFAPKFTFNMIDNPGPLAKLAGNPAGNFASGKYNAITLEDDLILYRGGAAGGGRNGLGQWFTRESPVSRVEVRIDNAVRPQWIDPRTGVLTGRSPIESVYSVRIPKGTVVYEGPVGYQTGVHVGGGGNMQIFVQEPWEIPGVKVLGEAPL